MELIKLPNINNLNQVNNVSSNLKANNLENLKETIAKHPTDKVDIEKTTNSSDFLSTMSINISKVANLQKLQSTISSQLEITSEIVKTTNSAVNSNHVQLDDKQPEIQNLLNNFNKLSEGFKPEFSDETGMFFDGRVGSKPLSSGEIYDAVSKQSERLSQFNQQISSKINSLVSNTQDTIATERTKVETKVEFKNIDYAKESAQFDSSTLGNIKGGVLPSQANAFPLHSEQLLA